MSHQGPSGTSVRPHIVPIVEGAAGAWQVTAGDSDPTRSQGEWEQNVGSRLLRPRLSRIEVSIPLPTPCHYQDAAGAAAGARALPQITLPPCQANVWQIARHTLCCHYTYTSQAFVVTGAYARFAGYLEVLEACAHV